MNDKALKAKEFGRLRAIADKDDAFRETLDFAKKAAGVVEGDANSSQHRIRMPYVSPSTLTERTWGKS
jgi:hypothetical protein